MSRIVQAETREYNLQQTNNPAPSSTSGWSKLDGGNFDDALILKMYFCYKYHRNGILYRCRTEIGKEKFSTCIYSFGFVMCVCKAVVEFL